jgi:hypothetical protein
MHPSIHPYTEIVTPSQFEGLSVKPSSATNVQDVFIYTLLSQHVSAYLMAILR